jgi:hypothetical protein
MIESQYFCVDCRNFQADDATCSRTARLDLVHGTTRFTLCSVERAYNTPDGCGEIGQHFVTLNHQRFADEELDDLSTIPFGK